jgi:hypothetical protein
MYTHRIAHYLQFGDKECSSSTGSAGVGKLWPLKEFSLAQDVALLLLPIWPVIDLYFLIHSIKNFL